MRILISGGTGMIGRALAHSLAGDKHKVVVLSRDPDSKRKLFPSEIEIAQWDGKTAGNWREWVDGADAIVNLAGERLAGPDPVRLRWTQARKRRICESRVHAGQAITQAIRAAAQKPGVVIQASGIDYYRAGDQVASEESPPGEGFLSRLCAELWEPSTKPVEALGVRRVVIRTGPVLHAHDGALPPLVFQTRLFAGGRLGSGGQWFSWIHIADVVQAIRFLIRTPEASGPFNLVAPMPLTNAEFSKALAGVLGRPCFFRVPAFALELLFGEMASSLLRGVRALPQRLQSMGYRFEFSQAERALRDLLK